MINGVLGPSSAMARFARIGSAGNVQITPSPRIVFRLAPPQHAFHRFLGYAAIRRQAWFCLAVADDKQTSSRLRGRKVPCIERAVGDLIAESLQLCDPFVESLPTSHLNDVFNDDPPRLQDLGKPDDLECGPFTALALRLLCWWLGGVLRLSTGSDRIRERRRQSELQS